MKEQLIYFFLHANKKGVIALDFFLKIHFRLKSSTLSVCLFYAFIVNIFNIVTHKISNSNKFFVSLAFLCIKNIANGSVEAKL